MQDLRVASVPEESRVPKSKRFNGWLATQYIGGCKSENGAEPSAEKLQRCGEWCVVGAYLIALDRGA